MIKKHVKILSSAFAAFIALCFIVPLFTSARAENMMVPNYTSHAGVQYHLSGPGQMTVELDLLGTHTITLTDSEPVTVEWNYNVPAQAIGYYPDSFQQGAVTFSRDVSIIISNSLVLQYSREAFESGQQFLTGELTQHISTYEHLASAGPITVEYNFDQVELVVSVLVAGNFESINNGSMEIYFDVTSDTIIDQFGTAANSYMSTAYSQLELVSSYAQEIGISPDFLIALIPDPVVVLSVIEEIIEEAEIPEEDVEEAVQEIIAVSEDVQEQIEEIIPIPQEPGAVASAVAVGLAGAAAAGASGAAGASSGISGIANAASGAMSAAAQQIVSSSAAATGGITISFIKDVLTGLRDMFMDEGRAHASGKVTENLKK